MRSARGRELPGRGTLIPSGAGAGWRSLAGREGQLWVSPCGSAPEGAGGVGMSLCISTRSNRVKNPITDSQIHFSIIPGSWTPVCFQLARLSWPRANGIRVLIILTPFPAHAAPGAEGKWGKWGIESQNHSADLKSHGQGHLPRSQIAPSHVQPGLGRCRVRGLGTPWMEPLVLRGDEESPGKGAEPPGPSGNSRAVPIFPSPGSTTWIFPFQAHSRGADSHFSRRLQCPPITL